MDKGYACHEVTLHYKRPLYHSRPKVSSSEDAYRYIKKIIDNNRLDYVETFYLLTLTNANRVLSVSQIASGAQKGVIVNTKEIFQSCLLLHAANFIVAHTHPSGELKPSNSDIKVTKELLKTATLLDLTLLDHLIISSEGYYSLADNNQMNSS